MVTGRTRRTAVSAVAASLGLTGVVLLAAAPTFSASASSRVATAADPGGTIDPAWPTVDVTETVTVTAEPTETADPVVTLTTTVTPDPTVTTTKTVTPGEDKPARSASPPPVSQDPVPPTSDPVTSSQPSSSPPSSEPELSLAPASPTDTPVATAPTSFEETTPDSVPIEIRNAAPEYDQIELSRQLAVPGILLVLLVVFAVFVFQGRLQRMAHAAAIRKAGPRPPGRPGGDAGTGQYAAPAYAPIISFVPVQGYPMAPSPGPYPPGYVDPQTGQAYPQPGYPPQPGQAEGYPPQQGGPRQPEGPVDQGFGFPQPGQPFPGQPDDTGQWAAPDQPWGPAPTPPPPGAPGSQEHQGHETRRPEDAPADWFTTRPEPPGGAPDEPFGPRPRHDDRGPHAGGEDGTPRHFGPSSEVPEPGIPPPIPGSWETVSVQRLGPDGLPMDNPPVRGTHVFPLQHDPGMPYPPPYASHQGGPMPPGGGQHTAPYPMPGGTPTVPDPGAAQSPRPPDDGGKKRRPWRRSK